MQELFIENYRADLGKNAASLLTYCIDDLKDFGAKNTNFSKTIVLPSTSQNDVIFNYFFDVNVRTQYIPGNASVSNNFNAAVGARAILFSDRIQVFKGIIRLMRIVKTANTHDYEVVLFGELGSFVNKLGNKKLQDLSFDTSVQTYALTSVLGAAASDWGAPHVDYVYPLIDYGSYGFNGKANWKYRTLRPAIFLKAYWNKIFAEAGFTFNMPLTSTGRWNSLIIPYNRKEFTRLSNDYLRANLIGGTSAGSTAINTLGSNSITLNGTTLGAFTVTGASFTNGATALSGLFQFKAIGQIHINEFTLSGVGYTVNLNAKVNGTNVLIVPIAYVGSTSGGGAPSYWHTFNYFNTVAVNVPASGVLTFALEYYSSTHNITIQADLNDIDLIYYGAKPEFLRMNLGDTFKIADIIPNNILQKNIVSDIAKLFNLYIFEDKASPNKLNIIPFNDFYNNNTLPALNWNDKVDRSKAITITPLGELNARYYQFAFAKDGDYYNDLYSKRYNETYGSKLYDSEFEFASETKKVELGFSGTPLVGYSGQDKVYSAIFKRSGTTEETTDSNIRLLQFAPIFGVNSYNIIDDLTATIATKTTYGYAGHYNNPNAPTNDINFGTPNELFFALATGAINVTQFNVYWSAYMAEITNVDSKLMQCTILLNVLDIENLDFSRKIFIDGQLWRINKVIDYNASIDDTCKIELINIINTTY